MIQSTERKPPPVERFMGTTSDTLSKSSQIFTPEIVERAYRYCGELAREHYENFPVGSMMIPKSYRSSLHSIYAFARIADDIADEGNLTPPDRLGKLDDWQLQLDECFQGRASHPAFIALAETVRMCNIPRKPFDDLLIAFRMDVTRQRFRTFEELLHYCRHSADPVGRLVLYVFGAAKNSTFHLSDHLCTGLQLANFWQDVSVDLAKGRVYIPLEDFEQFGYTERDLIQRVADERFRRLIEYQVSRTRKFFELAKPIMSLVSPALRTELSFTWRGGLTILNKIERSGFDVLSHRPSIGLIDKVRILFGTFLRGTA